MSAPANHCPFLNRADSRCSKHFSLDRLTSAFGHCFGEYKSCAVYGEQLAERRERRMSASLSKDGTDATTPVIQVTFYGSPSVSRTHPAATTSARHHFAA